MEKILSSQRFCLSDLSLKVEKWIILILLTCSVHTVPCFVLSFQFIRSELHMWARLPWRLTARDYIWSDQWEQRIFDPPPCPIQRFPNVKFYKIVNRWLSNRILVNQFVKSWIHFALNLNLFDNFKIFLETFMQRLERSFHFLGFDIIADFKIFL